MIQGRQQLKELELEHNNIHDKLFRFAQAVVPNVFDTVPTVDQVPVGYMALYNSGITYRIYINFNGIIKYWSLT